MPARTPWAAWTLLIAATVFFAGARGDQNLYQKAVQNPSRSAQDRERDVRERPDLVMAFARYKPGMQVADIFGGGGYYSELIGDVVGPRGKVFLVNNEYYDRSTQDMLTTRLAGNRLPNVVHATVAPDRLMLKPASLDAALIVMSFHDLYVAEPAQGWPAIDAPQFIDQVVRALKPNGTLLIVDHAAASGTGSSAAQTLHRIDDAFVRQQLMSHGLIFDADWDGLRNPSDDHSRRVFDPLIRGRTDRFVQLYRKPA